VDVIVVLAGIVEERGVLAERPLHDLLKRLALEFGALEQVVAVGHIGLMMLVVVIFQRLFRHKGLECVIGVRKFGKCECHGARPQ